MNLEGTRMSSLCATVDGCDEDFEMVREPKVVVAEVGHDPSTREPRAFVVRASLVAGVAGKVDPVHSRILKRRDDVGGFVGAAIAHDEQLEVCERLVEHAAD